MLRVNIFISKVIIFSVLLLAYMYSQANEAAKESYGDCRIDLIGAPFEVNECAMAFSQKLALLSSEELKTHQAQLTKLKKVPFPALELADLFRAYPAPEVLFEYQETGAAMAKRSNSDQALSYDDPATGLRVIEYGHDRTMYDTVIAMLNQKDQLTPDEQRMIEVSQQRSEYLGRWLDYLKEDEARTVNEKQIVDACFNNVTIL